MASGVILNECPVCRELIWEDDDYVVEKDAIKHKKCWTSTVNMSTIASMLFELTDSQKKRMLSLLEGLIKNDEHAKIKNNSSE
jgi:hypothetical protein